MLTETVGESLELRPEDQALIQDALDRGWMLEPDAKNLLKAHGFHVPQGMVTSSIEEAAAFLEGQGGPVVLKAVSEKILHKTEFNAVVTGIRNRAALEVELDRLMALEGCTAVLVEEMVSGIELFIGAKNDLQFGPVVILGLGGTAVEIYNDTAIRMAPVAETGGDAMVRSLKGAPLITGYRGRAGVNMTELRRTVSAFSRLAMALEPNLHSLDLNPVICTEDRCVAVDARIMLTDANDENANT